MECPVRCETYTARNPCTRCPYCQGEACLQCQKTFILGVSLDPHCMHCRRPWPPEVLTSLFPASFRTGDLRKHTVRLLAERERAYFPETLKTYETSKTMNAIDDAETLLLKLCQADAYPDKQAQLHTRLRTLALRRDALLREGGRVQHAEVRAPKPCPGASCSGFLSSAWKCVACSLQVCSSCEEPKKNEHICHPDNVNSVIAKRKDAKPCPKCGVYVHRIEGCNHMFCVACKTPFDWVMMTILSTRGFHNPHYQEWLNQTERTPHMDAPCVRGWPWDTMEPMLGDLLVLCDADAPPPTPPTPYHVVWGSPEAETLADVYKCMHKIHETDVTHGGYAYNHEAYNDLRERRVRGLIDDTQWCTQLSAKETTRTRKETMHTIDMGMLTAARDLIQRLRARCASVADTLAQLDTLRHLSNDQRKRNYEDIKVPYYPSVNASWFFCTEFK